MLARVRHRFVQSSPCTPFLHSSVRPSPREQALRGSSHSAQAAHVASPRSGRATVCCVSPRGTHSTHESATFCCGADLPPPGGGRRLRYCRGCCCPAALLRRHTPLRLCAAHPHTPLNPARSACPAAHPPPAPPAPRRSARQCAHPTTAAPRPSSTGPRTADRARASAWTDRCRSTRWCRA